MSSTVRCRTWLSKRVALVPLATPGLNATRFGDFYRYEPRVMAQVGSDCVPWPLGASYIAKRCGKDWKPAITDGRRPANLQSAAAPEEAVVLVLTEVRMGDGLEPVARLQMRV